MSFEVQLIEPWLSRVLPEGGSQEFPLASLKATDSHIHGELVILVSGARVPHLGFFGPRDVCIGTWIRELIAAQRALAVPGGSHVFDEGEQGQPAFKFRRLGDGVEVSVVDSEIGDGVGDSEWGTNTCTFAAFDRGIATFIADLASHLESEAPGVGRAWVDRMRTFR